MRKKVQKEKVNYDTACTLRTATAVLNSCSLLVQRFSAFLFRSSRVHSSRIILVHVPQANTLGQQHINVAKVTASESPPDCRFGAFQRWRRQCGVVPTTPLCTSALDDGMTMMTRRFITLHPSPVSRRYVESRRLF